MSFNEIDYQHVVDTHSAIIQMHGGLDGIRDSPALKSAIAQPFQNVFGVELYPSTADKCAALGFFICQAHAFCDCNKRTALRIIPTRVGSIQR